jgi:RNA polymerase sigma-70 factor (ECF subfamily)
MATGQGSPVPGGPCPKPDAAPGVEDPTDGQLLERFVSRRDEAAFAALVRRHGPAVRGVCRRVLGDAHHAEDASQAVFLVLTRKAASLGRRKSLAGWLRAVAYRTALKARGNVARRWACERRVVPLPTVAPPDEVIRREVRTTLDEELSRLPECYRAPLVLCYLEGRTNEDAARELGWPAGSISYRLARGRAILRARLAHRGQGSAGVPSGVVLSRGAAVRAPMLPTAGQAARSFAAPRAAASGVPARERL